MAGKRPDVGDSDAGRPSGRPRRAEGGAGRAEGGSRTARPGGGAGGSSRGRRSEAGAGAGQSREGGGRREDRIRRDDRKGGAPRPDRREERQGQAKPASSGGGGSFAGDRRGRPTGRRTEGRDGLPTSGRGGGPRRGPVGLGRAGVDRAESRQRSRSGDGPAQGAGGRAQGERSSASPPTRRGVWRGPDNRGVEGPPTPGGEGRKPAAQGRKPGPMRERRPSAGRPTQHRSGRRIEGERGGSGGRDPRAARRSFGAPQPGSGRRAPSGDSRSAAREAGFGPYGAPGSGPGRPGGPSGNGWPGTGSGAARSGAARSGPSPSPRVSEPAESPAESTGERRSPSWRLRRPAGLGGERIDQAPAEGPRRRTGWEAPGARRSRGSLDRARSRGSVDRPRTAALDVRPAAQTVPAAQARSLSTSFRPTGGLPAALARARGAFVRQRDTEVVSVLRPISDRFPDSAETHELLGLAYYRLGRYTTALRHLEAFSALSASLDRFPVAMDCLRALGRHRGVADLWEDLRVVSPSAEVVIEGRIVMAGSLADKGRLGEAIALLERSAVSPRRLQDHHLRQWYALADLEEQAGNLPRARALFERVARHDRQLGDVVERLAALA